MKVGIELGLTRTGEPLAMDLEELLSTRLLVQGNSGSGKSHLLRRLLEQSAGAVQQAIIDPEGDFVSLADRYGHVVVEADRSPGELTRIATRIRQHRASVVLNLEGLDAEEQMRCAAAFLNGLFDADRDYWFPMLIAVDEAQLFAPAAAGDVADEARKISLGAMTNLMCRGRKRGLAGIIATQRLAKLAKNVAAEASNFLMGRTFLDIDMARAADLLGMERRQAEAFRDLESGRFIALGPAVSRRPIEVRIGTVETRARSGRPSLLAMPEIAPDALQDLIFEPGAEIPPPPPPRVRAALRPVEIPQTAIAGPFGRRIDALATAERRSEIEAFGSRPEFFAAPAVEPEPDPRSPEERAAELEAIYAEVLADPETPFRPLPLVYQDFLLHCRVHRLADHGQDLSAFRRRLNLARAGIADAADPDWAPVIEIAEALPEEMQSVFLIVARAARERAPCPSDEDLARAYGSHSPSRGRWLLTFMGERGVIRSEVDFRGYRSVIVAGVGWRTAPGHPKGVEPVPRRRSERRRLGE